MNYQFPVDLNGEVISFNPKLNPFTVPEGKHLYILHFKSPTHPWFIVNDVQKKNYFLMKVKLLLKVQIAQ